MFDFEKYGAFEKQYTVEDCRRDLNNVVTFFREQDYHQAYMKAALVEERQLPIEVADMLDLFWVSEDLPVGSFPEWMQSESLGVVRKGYSVMFGRLVYPVKDVNGDVMGFVGWDPFVEPKYLDSKNYGYKAKSTSLLGMERIRDYYTNDKMVIVVEGAVCMAYLRVNKFQAMATLGSILTPYVVQILRRFGRRLLVIPDNDEAGDSYVRQVKYKVPKALIWQPKYGKDVDGCRKLDEHVYEQDLLNDLRNASNPFYIPKIFIRR